MSNPSKRRGTAWESAACAYQNGVLEYTHPADWRLIKRAAQTGARDVGDAHAWPFIEEMKDVKSPAVPTWLRQADTEAINAGFPYGVVIHKTRGKGPALAKVHISDETLLRLTDDVDIGIHDVMPALNTRSNYWTWTLAEFCEVLRVVREDYGSPTNP